MRALVRMEDEDKARLLGDSLYAEGIESRVDESREGGFVVWVHDEAHMDRAKEILRAFEDDPFDERFQRARKEADARRKQLGEEEKRRQKQSRHRKIDVRQRWQSQSAYGRLTLGLIITSVAVTLLSGTLFSEAGGNTEVIQWVAFSWGRILGSFEVWRIFTPIFLHFGFLHIVFNMWWLKDFGAFIEYRHSTKTLAAMVLVMGGLSNIAQALFSLGLFGGMSGVIYGLFGYLWIRGRFDPTWGYSIPRSTVLILLGWMVLGFLGFFRMANLAHFGGLVVGVVWGFLASGWLRRKLR